MNKKTLYIFSFLAVMVFASLLWFFNGRNVDDLDILKKLDTDNSNITFSDGIINHNDGFIDGVLQRSENSELGNLKLLSRLGDIYIRTQRDYTVLFGTQVLVLINGTFENFELIDIQPKVVGDEGYLINN